MAALKNTYPKKQRLKSRKKLQQLFAAKKAVSCGTVKLLYFVEEADAGTVKCGVGLSGRYFKKAVDRNRIKRLLREAYRLQQHELNFRAHLLQKEVSVFILYTGKTMPDYSFIFEQVGCVLQKLLLATILNTENSNNEKEPAKKE